MYYDLWSTEKKCEQGIERSIFSFSHTTWLREVFADEESQSPKQVNNLPKAIQKIN